MRVRIVASQPLDPVWPEDREHSETAAEHGDWSDQSSFEDFGLVAGVHSARLRVSSAREHRCSPVPKGRRDYVKLVSSRLQSPGCGTKDLNFRAASAPLAASKSSLRKRSAALGPTAARNALFSAVAVIDAEIERDNGAAVRPAFRADEICKRHWQSELGELEARLALVDQQLGAPK
jgi:hypothetical protein